MPAWKPRNTTRARELRNQATPAERLLWRHLARSLAGAKFSRQMQVGKFFADFLCRELKLVVELDGFSHDLRPDYDAARDRWFCREGYHVLRFSNADVLADPETASIAICEEVKRLRAGLPLGASRAHSQRACRYAAAPFSAETRRRQQRGSRTVLTLVRQTTR